MPSDIETSTPAAAPAPAQAHAMGGMLNDSTLYFVGNIAAKIVGFVMIPFYAHHLDTEQYGVLNLLELATTIVAMAFGVQSVGAAMTRIYHEQTDEAGRRTTISTALIGTIMLAALVMGGAVLLAGPISEAVSLNGQAGLLRLSFVAMFASSIGEGSLVYERMRNRARFFLAYAMVTLVATLSLNILLIGFVHLGVWGFLISKVTVATLGSAFLLTRSLREVGVAMRAAVAWALARFASPLILSGLSFLAIHFSDRLFLAHVSRADVGVYSLIYTFAFLLSAIIGDSFSKSWSVSFYGLSSGTGWQTRFVLVGRWLIVVLGAGAVGIALFGRDVLMLMVPPSYDPPALLLPVLVLGYFLREVGDFYNSMLLIGIGSGLVARIAIAGAVLNLVLNAVLIPAMGIWGAAWATLATWAAYCLMSWAAAWRVHGFVMSPWPLTQVLGVSVLCLWVRHAAAPSGAVAMLALDCVCFGLFLALSMVFYLSRGERETAYGWVRRGAERLRVAARDVRAPGKA